MENKVRIDILSLFGDDIENRPGVENILWYTYLHRVPRYFGPGIRAVQTSTHTRGRYLLQTGSHTS